MRKGLKWGSLILVLLIIIGVIAGAIRLNNFSNAISGKGLLTSEINQRAGNSNRFNLLVMGYGGQGHPGANLTDSMLIYSMPKSGGKGTELSIPRDLWVQSTTGSGTYTKVNALYATAYAQTQDRTKAADRTTQAVSQALGVPIHGWMLVDFNGFRDLVNALGGVDVNVQRSFGARYPKADNPSVSTKWINIYFKKGEQHMNGERAIRYARARESSNPLEGSDFARAARQQRLVSAIKSKLLSPAGWIHAPAVMGAVENHIYTDVSAGDLIRIFSKGVNNKDHIVLSNQNVLADGTSSDGQYILVPRTSWADVHNFVRDALNGNQTSS